VEQGERALEGLVMKFEPAPLAGALVIEMQLFRDDRGFFSYSFDRAKFQEQGIAGEIVQTNLSFNLKKGTLRGMHFQAAPKAQPKLVRCTAGVIFDVIVDLRENSATYRQWFGIELSAENHRSLYIPAGFAHGFQTQSDNAELLYDMFEWYAPESARGVRYNDPAFGIRWPLDVSVISDRDTAYADFETAR
jgi:dTDP-4-dehydrorhamnose 3,5-epimerase